MIAKGILCCALIGLMVSCKSASSCSTVVQNGSALCSIVRSVDTVVVRDSVFVSEKMRGDTIYLTRVEYRDRWRTQMVHDTIVKTDSIVQVIEHPPERYVPKFHQWCTGLLFVLLLVIVIVIVLKIKG